MHGVSLVVVAVHGASLIMVAVNVVARGVMLLLLLLLFMVL